MMDHNLRAFTSFILLAIFIDSAYTNSSSDNDSSTDFLRQPRIQGRKVKLYSGSRPEPFLCPREGFLPDPKDCAVFYRCVKATRNKYNVFRFECGPGTVYDPDTEICNHPQLTKRYECGTGYVTPNKQNSENDIDELPLPLKSNIPIYNTQVETNDHVFTEQMTTNRPVNNEPVSPNLITTNREELKSDRPLYVNQLTTNRPVYKEQLTSRSIYIEKATTSEPLHTKQLATKNIITSTPIVASINRKMFPTTEKKNLKQGLTTNNYFHQKNLRSKDFCTSDGFMGDSDNCRKFYRCVGNGRGGFIKYEFSCSESTIWDDSLEACNHPWAVKKRRCGVLTETKNNKNETFTTTYQQLSMESIQEHTERISVLRVTHIDDLPPIKKYFENATYNSSLLLNNMQPSYDDTIKIDNQTEIKKKSEGNKNVVTEIKIPPKQYNSNRKNNQISTLATTTASKNHDNTGDITCISSGFMGDEKDCKKFYRCVDNGGGKYTRYEFTCGEGTVWDSKLEACNHIWAVKNCGQKVTDLTTIASTSTVSVQIDYTTMVDTNINKQEDIYGYQNLQQFSTTGMETTSQLTQVDLSMVRDEDSKESDCNSNGFMGNPKNCKIFYRCVDSGNGKFIKYEYLCGEGTVWDSTIQSCNHIWAAKTCEEINDNKINQTKSTLSTEITTVSLIRTTTEKITEKDENDVAYGEPHVSVQPLSSTSAVTDKQQDKIGNRCQTSGFIGDKEDCKKFYRCIDNGNGLSYTRYEFTCGEGTVWDPNISACNHQWAVKNCGRASENNYNKLEETTLNSEYTMSEEEINSEHPAENDVKPNKPTESYLTSMLPFVTTVFITDSTCKNSGFMGDIHNCKKFYRCVDDGKGDFIRYEFLCGEGTIWDKTIESCNHEAYVKDCRNNMSLSTVPQNISTSFLPSVTTERNDYSQPTDKQSSVHKSELNNTCTTEGFVGDTQDCRKFYRCVYNEQREFIMYQFSCGDGTAWDSEINSCNHEMAVKRPCSSTIQNNEQSIQETTTEHKTENTNTQYLNDDNHTTSTTKPFQDYQCEEEGFFKNKNNCKKFYRCVEDGMGGYNKFEFSCGEGTIWDQEIKSCNYEKTGHHCDKTENTIQNIETNNHNNEMYEEDTTKTYTDETNNYETTSTKKPQVNNCEMEGFFGDPNNCKKFYRCVEDNNKIYTKYEFMCGDGTVWDQKLQTCNYESNDKSCSNSFQTSNSETVQPQTEAFSPDNAPTTEPNLISSSNVSEDSLSVVDDECRSEGFFSNSKDCKKFYRCVSDEKGSFTKYDFSCGDGTVWVQEIQACDHDNDVNSYCKTASHSTSNHPQISEASTETSTSSSLASTESHKQHDEYPDENSSKPTPNGETKCSSEGFFPNPMDCTKFYRCVDNGQGQLTKYDFTCGEGTAWDVNVQTCNYISEVENCKKEDSSGSQSKPVTENNEITHTSEQTETDSNESSKPAGNNVCEKEGYFGDENDCKKFYRCVDNGNGGYTKYDYNCGEGTIWDQDITSCNHPQDVAKPSCKMHATDTESSTSISSSSTSSSAQVTDGDNNNQNTSDCYHEDSSKQPENKNVTCTKAGFYADPNDCTKFYRCVDWNNDEKRFSVFHFNCGEGTIWDPAIETCNYEESVYPPRDCSGSQTQNDNIYESSTTDKTSTEKSETTTSKEDTTTESTEKSTSEQTTQQSTTEKTTTEESTTTQTTTTEKSKTTEKSTTKSTTTQKSTTSEQTTQQSTTSEKTTSQPTDSNEDTTTTTTTTESSTTEKSTTEKTATDDQSNTDNQTTTEQSTTSEQTTTEQSTTSKQTTTEQSTTSEQTTTEQSTTSEQTTTDLSTTSEQTTTDQSTTNEQTTTEEHTQTTEKTTTEQSTTTEEPTSQQSTTDESTTQESSTEQTTDSQSTTEDSQNTTTEATSSSDTKCPETDDDQYTYVCPTSFRRHPKYCNLFYQCLEDDENHELKIAVFNCPNNTIYDENKTQCVEEKDADIKCEGETAQRRKVKRLDANYKEPIVVSRGKRSCPTEGHFPFERNEECSPAFLKCKKSKSSVIRGFVYRCPEGYMYWSISRRCELSSHLQHCHQNDNDWKGRWDIPMERKNIS